MTEAEWLASNDPTQMFKFLQGTRTVEVREHFGRLIPFEVHLHPKASPRKFRLAAVALCRRYWSLLDEPHCRKLIEVGDQFGGSFAPTGLPPDTLHNAVELAERAADELASADELKAAHEAADLFHFPGQDYAACYVDGLGPYDNELVASGEAAYAVYHATFPEFDGGEVRGVIHNLLQAAELLRSTGRETGDTTSDRTAMSLALKDISGNPFRPVAFSPEWRTSTAVAIALQMYESRDFSAMPILGDALQDAGCDRDDILAHCRGDGPHVRGCWVVDLALGKE